MYNLEKFTIKDYKDEDRDCFVLLPDDYDKTKIYKVLYMHDAQCVFFKEKSLSNHSWEIKEAIEMLVYKGIIDPIIIACVNHGEENRILEMTPWKDKDLHFKTGFGKEYAKFFMDTFIKEVESKYSVSKAKSDRFIAGSSLGALMSAYIELMYPRQFSKVGIFSLASWIRESEFIKFIKDNKKKKQNDVKYFIQVGTEEVDFEDGSLDIEKSERYINSTIKYYTELLNASVPSENIRLIIGVKDKHSEKTWSKYMEEFIVWLLS